MSMQICDRRIAALQIDLAIAQTAQNADAVALNSLLPKAASKAKKAQCFVVVFNLDVGVAHCPFLIEVSYCSFLFPFSLLRHLLFYPTRASLLILTLVVMLPCWWQYLFDALVLIPYTRF